MMDAYDKTSIQINRCKRILALVDTYVEQQTAATRTDLRMALMKEFEAPAIAPPVAAGSVDTTEFKRLCNALYLANPPLREGERLRMVAHIDAWGGQRWIAGALHGGASTQAMIDSYARRISEAEKSADVFAERAEKAEARVKELERLLKSAEWKLIQSTPR